MPSTELAFASSRRTRGARSLDGAGIESCVDNMGRESDRILDRLRTEIHAVAAKLAGARTFVILDPVTGLINRREMERKRMEAACSAAETSAAVRRG